MTKLASYKEPKDKSIVLLAWLKTFGKITQKMAHTSIGINGGQFKYAISKLRSQNHHITTDRIKTGNKRVGYRTTTYFVYSPQTLIKSNF